MIEIIKKGQEDKGLFRCDGCGYEFKIDFNNQEDIDKRVFKEDGKAYMTCPTCGRKVYDMTDILNKPVY